MKTKLFAALAIFTLVLAGCAQAPLTPLPSPVTESPQLPTVQPTGESAAATAAPLTPDMLKNATYYAPYTQKYAPLVDGHFEKGSGSDFLSVTLLPQVAMGDLNGDGVTDAAVLLAENSGGSGTFVSLLAILNQNGKLVQAANPAPVDDRPQINDLKIQDGKILLDAIIHGPNDSMVLPTLADKSSYAVTMERMWLTHLEYTASGGSPHSITIESPLWGAEVSQSVQVKGSMPISPFEATLGYSIEDAAGNPVDRGSFMVTSADVGAPATFDHTFDLTGVPSGTILHISLFEADMSAFHQFLALDSVEVKVK